MISSPRESTDRKWMLIAFLFFALMKPDGFERIPSLWIFDVVLTFGQVFVMAYAVWLYFRQPISLTLIIILALGLIPIITDVLRGQAESVLDTRFYTWLKIVAVVMIVEAYVSNRDEVSLLQGIFISSFFILVLNLVCTYAWNPGGIYSPDIRISEIAANVFYGQKNTLRNPLFIGLLAGLLLQQYRSNFKAFVLYIVLGLCSLLLAESATSVVVFLTMVMLVFVFRLRSVRINAWACLAFVCISWLLVVVIGQMDLFQRLIVETLHRDMTLSGRTQIWASAYEMFLQSPIIGNGMSVDIIYHNANNPFLTVPHAHNEIVDLAIRGGLVAVALFLFLAARAAHCISNNADRVSANAFAIVVFGFLFASIFGELWNPSYYAALALCFTMTSKSYKRQWARRASIDGNRAIGGADVSRLRN